MILNKISAEVSQELQEQLMQELIELRKKCPYLIDLDQEARKRLAKLSRRRQDFIDKTLVHAKQNPHLLPGYTSLK